MWGIGWSFISFAKDAPTRASELRGISRKIDGFIGYADARKRTAYHSRKIDGIYGYADVRN